MHTHQGAEVRVREQPGYSHCPTYLHHRGSALWCGGSVRQCPQLWGEQSTGGQWAILQSTILGFFSASGWLRGFSVFFPPKFSLQQISQVED